MAKVFVLEEGTTNHIISPHIELAASQGGGDSIYTTTRPSPNTVRQERIGEGSYAYVFNTHLEDDFRVGDEWTISFEARGADCNMDRSRSQLWLRSNAATDVLSPFDMPAKKPNPVISDEIWQRFEYSFKVPPEAYAHNRYRTLSSGWLRNIGSWIEVRNPQLEHKPYATSFTHGDMGEGYSWTGTPHNSSSIREPSSISMPSPEPKSLYIRYSEDGENWINKYSTFDDEQEDVYPSLLMRPEGSYSWTPEDGVQEVTPTINGNVQVVDGQYGEAWGGFSAGNERNSLQIPNPLSLSGGTPLTILARITPGGLTGAAQVILTDNRYLTLRGQTDMELVVIGDNARRIETSYLMETGVPIVAAYRYSGVGQGGAVFSNGIKIGSRPDGNANSLDDTWRVGSFGTVQSWSGLIESILIYDIALSDAEIHRISTMPEAWTMENSISYKIQVPLGEHAELVRKDGELHLSTRKKLYIGTVIGFSRPLSQKEVAILDSTPLAYINGKTLLNLPDTTIGVSQLV